MRSKLYKLAVWYIGKCNAKWDKNNNGDKLKSLDGLTYRNVNKAYLSYGADAEWQNFSRYDVLDNAVQRLAEYEDAKDDEIDKEIRNKAIEEFENEIEKLLLTNHWDCLDIEDVRKIAEQMKVGGIE